MKNYKIHPLFFKQTIILFMVSFFLFSLTTIFHFGIIGVVVFIRALFMLNTEYKGYNNYKVLENDSGFYIHRGEEHFFLPRENIQDISIQTNKIFKNKTIKITVENNNYKSLYVLKYLK